MAGKGELSGALVIAVWGAILALSGPAAASRPSLADIYRRGVVELEPVYTIGGEDAGHNEALYLVLGYDVDSAGNLFAADAKLHCVKSFDSTGTWVTTFGKKGEGPGDLMFPSVVRVGAEGDVWVSNASTVGVARFTPGGDPVGSYRIQEGAIVDLEPGRGGGFCATVEQRQMGLPSAPKTVRLVRLGSDFETLATIDSMGVHKEAMIGDADDYLALPAPFPPSLEFAVLSDGRLVVGHSDTPELRILGPGGEPIGAFDLDVDPAPVTDREKRRYLDSGFIPDDDRIRGAISFPEWMPYYSDIVADPEGNILLRWPVPVDGKTLFYAFDGEGRPISRLSLDILPEDVRIRGRRLYARFGRFPAELPTITCYRMR